nr:MAG TPA: hypothetical protein [Caudoviricetes sp.]
MLVYLFNKLIGITKLSSGIGLLVKISLGNLTI